MLDAHKNKTPEEADKIKRETLITTLSGANDLINVNKKPTIKEADNAIDAIVSHIESLEAHGYSQFALFNLPDLTKTPFYQKQLEAGDINTKELDEIRDVIKHFNTQLTERGSKLTSRPMVFDVYARFNQVCENPEAYGFDPNKLTKPISDNPKWKLIDSVILSQAKL